MDHRGLLFSAFTHQMVLGFVFLLLDCRLSLSFWELEVEGLGKVWGQLFLLEPKLACSRLPALGGLLTAEDPAC